MYEGNDRNRGTGGVNLIRVMPHDRELDKQRERVEGRRNEKRQRDAEGQLNRQGQRDEERQRNRQGQRNAERQRGAERQYNGGRRHMTKRRRAQKRMALLSTVACTVLLGFGGIHFVKTTHLDLFGEEVQEMTGENQPEEMLGEPVTVPAGDVLQREEEPDSGTPLVVIDPGHGGEDTGCDRNGVMESEVNLELARRLSGKLQGLGFETLLLREDDETSLSLEERVTKAESVKADIYVSIHQNAYEEDADDVKGIETWYYGEQEGSRKLAQLIHRNTVEQTGTTDRGIQDTDELYVVKNTSMPACLIETSFLSSRTDRENIVTGEYQDKVAEGIAAGINVYFHPKTMYLTFDDGPSADNTSAILDILKERNIKATFFVVGENVRKHPDVARRIVEEGHTIGIHCNNHDYKQVYQSVDSYLEDFQKAYDIVYEVTGVEAKLFRFPGGSVNAYNKAVGADIITAMTEKGYIYFDWNASLEDAVGQSTPGSLIQNAVSSTLGRKKVVMLAHDVIYNTAQCLEELLDSLPEYEMKPLTEDVEPIQF